MLFTYQRASDQSSVLFAKGPSPKERWKANDGTETSFSAHWLYPTGGELEAEQPEKDRVLMYTQLRNAGYRLAKALDYIFDTAK